VSTTFQAFQDKFQDKFQNKFQDKFQIKVQNKSIILYVKSQAEKRLIIRRSCT